MVRWVEVISCILSSCQNTKSNLTNCFLASCQKTILDFWIFILSTCQKTVVQLQHVHFVYLPKCTLLIWFLHFVILPKNMKLTQQPGKEWILHSEIFGSLTKCKVLKKQIAFCQIDKRQGNIWMVLFSNLPKSSFWI